MPPIPLQVSSTINVASEMGGAFMSPSRCDEDGNLYVRKYASDRPMLGPVVKIDGRGQRSALFDPSSFSQLNLTRADSFTPASDGGIYQIAQSGVENPRIYVLHFSPDGSPSSPVRLDADFEVYSFAAFPSGNLLVSGLERDLQNKHDPGHSVTAVFSADGRLFAHLSFDQSGAKNSENSAARQGSAAHPESEKSLPVPDLTDAEVGIDGNLYALRNSAPALIYVISPAGKILRTITVAAPVKGIAPSSFHVSQNRVAVAFDSESGEILVVVDAQTGERIATYSRADIAGTTFACYSADESAFTFVRLGEKNELEIVRAEAE